VHARAVLILAVATSVVAGCAAGESSSIAPSAAPSAQESLVMPSLPPKGQLALTGTLGYDDIEGGCPYLDTGDGTRYQVMYPDGWQVDRGSGVLSGPEGQRVELGAQLTVRGEVMTDMVSTCQIGPIFQATEVVLVPR
jgi:hypothetical protein